MEDVGYRLLFLSCVSVFCSLAFGDNVDVNLQQTLINRIEALEIQGKEQALMLAAQRKSMMTMENKLEEQSQKLLRQDEMIREYKDRLRQLETTVTHLQSAAESTTEALEDQEMESDQQKNPESKRLSTVPKIRTDTAARRKRALVSTEGPVAFHAVIQPHVEVNHIGINQRIVFPDVLLNSGGGYHNQHGVFIAPQPGYYIFSTSILSFNTVHMEIYVHLMKNGQVLANAYAHGDSGRHDQGSVTVVTRLAVGDEVWVNLYGLADTSLWGDSFDTFMGCLVIPE